MDESSIELLFKMPQNTTRSKFKQRCTTMKKLKNSPKAKSTTLTKKKLLARPRNLSHIPFCKTIEEERSACSDSGYSSSNKSSSRCHSVCSRESDASERTNSLGEEKSDSGASVTPPGIPNRLLDLDANYMGHLCPKPKVLYLQNGTFQALVPACNVNEFSGQFTLTVETKPELFRKKLNSDLRVHHLSPVVSVKPHGIEFYDNEPAILFIPLKFEPRDEAWVSCLYSNTTSTSTPVWERLPRRDFKIRNGYAVIIARHFSMFTVIEEKPYPEIMKRVRCRTGGRLRIPDVPGIEVTFPRGCLTHDIDAYLRVLFDNEPLLEKSYDNEQSLPLASPIISLGPHGLNFGENNAPVIITLPIPDYDSIIASCPMAKLVAFQSSSTDENSRMTWQRVPYELPEPKVVAYRHGISGLPIRSISFPVHHFSFFKVVWELLSSGLYEAKMGMSYFYPYISFSMTCQAFMEESNENNRFGLEVICYRSDRKLPETTNYRHRVGASLKPKLVRPGKISVRLRSQMFEADLEAGEDKEMVKVEPDFRGRDFEKQYACKFKPESTIERGPFGKVIVERIAKRTDPIFEFNLHKTGVENTETQAGGCERWTIFAMKELAASLEITEGNNWKMFAKHIGFTKNEIKNKLNYAPDPFIALMNLYNARGGTPEEFVQALYVVSRDIRLRLTNGSNGSLGSPSSGSSRSSNDQAGGSRHSQDSRESRASLMQRMLQLRPWTGSSPNATNPNAAAAAGSKLPVSPKNSDSENGQGSSTSGKKRVRTNLADTFNHLPKRRRFSGGSDTDLSSNDGERNDIEERRTVSTEKHKSNTRKLSDKDLWRISSGIARKDWRNLGRTLGIEEIVLGNLEHSHQSVGFRECAYQMLLEWKGRKPRKCTFGELYSALTREKMASVAKFMVRKIEASDPEKNSESD